MSRICSAVFAMIILGGGANFVACKPLARQAVSDIHAVSDARLTLGVVPIQNDKGKLAYRMLLCKKAETYPPSMLADDSRCRVALRNRDGAEVAFLPNQFKRSFGTKYKGYAKQATILTLAVIPVALVGFVAGGWRHMKKMGPALNEEVRIGSKALPGDFTGDLIKKGLGDDGFMYYNQGWIMQVESYLKLAKWFPDTIAVRLGDITKASKTLTTAAELKGLGDAKKLANELRGLSPDARATRLTELDNEIKSLDTMDDGSSFVDKFKDLAKRFSDLTAPRTEQLTREEYVRITKDIGETGKLWQDGLARFHEITSKRTMEIKHDLDENGFEIHIKDLDTAITRRKEALVAEEAESLRKYVEAAKILPPGKRDARIGGAAGAGLGAALMLAIDKSVWGYADRQVSKHWNQIFIENDDFSDTRRVKDVQFILQALADTFDFVVSTRALQLAD